MKLPLYTKRKIVPGTGARLGLGLLILFSLMASAVWTLSPLFSAQADSKSAPSSSARSQRSKVSPELQQGDMTDPAKKVQVLIQTPAAARGAAAAALEAQGG